MLSLVHMHTVVSCQLSPTSKHGHCQKAVRMVHITRMMIQMLSQDPSALPQSNILVHLNYN